MEEPMGALQARPVSHRETNVEQKSCHEKEFKTICVCMVEFHESIWHRAESLQSKIREVRTAGKGFTSMTHSNVVHIFIPMPQAMKIPDAKAAVKKKWRKLETSPAWDLGRVKSKKEVILEAQRDRKQSPVCVIDGHVPPRKMQSRNPKFWSFIEESCSGVTSFQEPTQSSLSKAHLHHRWLLPTWRTSSRCSIWGWPALLKNPMSECPKYGYVSHDTIGQNHEKKIKNPVVPLGRQLHGHLFLDYYGKDSSSKLYCT